MRGLKPVASMEIFIRGHARKSSFDVVCTGVRGQSRGGSKRPSRDVLDGNLWRERLD